ncbi:hypothetical protein [Aquimarina algiphila]|uniref:hypothetical protein n=1 Tax=Aquimarina algiphila TaxID=2047982 RepID=UPI00232BCD9D|nr:hypothetical protein [Aquimarina algiphila]
MKNFLLFFLLTTSMIGQQTIDNGIDPEGSSAISPYSTTMIVRNAPIDNSIRGHQYYEEYNSLATVYIDKKRARKCLVRYNAFKDEIEVTENDKAFNMLKIDDIEVALDGYAYKLYDYEGGKQFFIVFNEGRYSLGIKAQKKIKAGKQASTGYETSTPSRYIEVNKYCIIDNEKGEIKNVKLKKKEILKVLNKKTEIEKFASSKKLSFKKEKDLIKIINYYNSL